MSERKRLGQNFARAATRALKGGALLGQPRLREAIELKILAAQPLHAPTHAAMLKLQAQRGASKLLRRPAPLVIAGWPLAPVVAERRTPTAKPNPLKNRSPPLLRWRRRPRRGPSPPYQ